IVPHGEKFTLPGDVKYRSFWKPARVRLEFPDGHQIAAQAANGTFVIDLPPQTKDSVVTIRAGDASERVKLLARHRPAVELATAEIQLPEYLRYSAQEQNAQA